MSDRILGGLALVGSAGMAIAAWGYAAPIDYEPVGPRAFPLLLAVLIALCGAYLLLRPAASAALTFSSRSLGVGACALAVLLYGVLFQWLGFILATALLVLPVGRAFGGNWKQCAITGAVMGVALFLLFDKLLDVVLPLGLLKPVFTALGL